MSETTANTFQTDVTSILEKLIERTAPTYDYETDDMMLSVAIDSIALNISTDSQTTFNIQDLIKPERRAVCEYSTDDTSFHYSIVGENTISATISGNILTIPATANDSELTISVTTEILGADISKEVKLLLYV